MTTIPRRPVLVTDENEFLKLVQVVDKTLHAFLSFGLDHQKKRLSGILQATRQIDVRVF